MPRVKHGWKSMVRVTNRTRVTRLPNRHIDGHPPTKTKSRLTNIPAFAVTLHVLLAQDLDSRTPLFMACASDRLEKAEFLCELLEYAGQDLGEADKRGDTPIHAAACNGSTACLLLLLQYGVAPDVRNAKGLRAIDLATRKGQTACEKILLEYQLHHKVDDSYFDSVLFLATLEVKCSRAWPAL